jgi:hypothetical protein
LSEGRRCYEHDKYYLQEIAYAGNPNTSCSEAGERQVCPLHLSPLELEYLRERPGGVEP